MFVLTDSRTGYILNIFPYTGSEMRKEYLSSVNPDLTMLAQVVIGLTEKYLDKGHHIYADRLYSSVPLVDELDRRGTGYTASYPVWLEQSHSK